MTRFRIHAILLAALALLVTGLPAEADAKRRSLGSRTLEPGMRGTDVRVLQDFLTRIGFRTRVDGVYGPGTTRNVRRFERASKMKVDGRLTRSDARRLRARLAGVGGATYQPPPPPIEKARLASDGTAIAPASAPPEVKKMIEAANEIHKKPYRYGGGHARFPKDSGYDCSGSMSYVLHAAGLLDAPMDSTGFMSWGKAGRGRWVTTYAHGGHAYMIIAGLRFDTSNRDDGGSRWDRRKRSSRGFTVRHFPGL